MKKLLFIPLFATLFAGCDVIQQVTQTAGLGTVTQAEAGQGIKEALSQGLVKAVLQLNKPDAFLKMPPIKFCCRQMQ